MPVAMIGIGLPGSGKSTMLRALVQNTPTVYVCPDDIRFELTGNATDQTCTTAAWEVAYSRIEAALIAGQDVVVDATNAKRHDRQKLASHCHIFGAQVQGVWFKTPYRTCLQRNADRSRVVPEFVIGLMAGWLEACPPVLEDGFDDLTVIAP